MLISSGSYKYYSWESKWLLTCLTRAYPNSNFVLERVTKILKFSLWVLIHIIIIRSVWNHSEKQANGGWREEIIVIHAPTGGLDWFYTQSHVQKLCAVVGRRHRVRAVRGRIDSRGSWVTCGSSIWTRADPNLHAWRVSASERDAFLQP